MKLLSMMLQITDELMATNSIEKLSHANDENDRK